VTQVIFTVATSGDDGYAVATEAVYPPLGISPSADSSQQTDSVVKLFGGGFYQVQVGLIRWDTSSLPDDANIISATLRVSVAVSFGADARSLTAEWYDPGTIDAADWTATVGTTAHAGTPLTSPAPGVDYDFALRNLTSISLTSFTGLRLHISGAAPTGTNSFAYASSDDVFYPAPRLVVQYTSSLESTDTLAAVFMGRGSM
jgi:hypothetical protein